MLDKQMVSTGQGDETGATDAGSQLAPGLEWNHLVVPHVHSERRHRHFGQKFNDIDIADDVKYRAAHSGEVVLRCNSLK